MITHSPPRRAAAVLTAVAVAAGALMLPGAAAAAEGSAPSPQEFRVIAGVHTDAVSTFLDEGQLALGSKADVAEGNGTRFAADDIWFHLEDGTQMTVPSGYEFIGDVGSTVWMAPESNPGTGKLWPGFNTESIPSGAIENDRTTLTLTDFDGPGELEVFVGGGFGAPERLWSSRDARLKTFQIGRTHMHANWAFTAAGTYSLGVQADVTIGGAVQTARETYTFVVGDLPSAVETTTALSASSASLTVGDSLMLTAQVSPADARGYVEFRNGSTVLGHEPLSGGSAALTTTAPAVGTHALTAVYVPSVSNLAQTSTSQPVSVTVTDATGVEFGIGGISSSYQVGDTLEARVVGHALEQGQTYRWAWRPVGVTSSYVLTGTGGQESAGFLTMPLDMSHDDYEISVAIRQGSTTLTRSAWVPLVVESDVVPITGSFPSADLYLGDDILFELDRAPAEGESARLAYRFTSGPWAPVPEMTEQVDSDTLRLRPTYALNNPSWVVQTVRDGRVVAQSDAFDKGVTYREVIVQGLQSVYRVGQTLRATASIYPDIEGLTYRWQLSRYTGGDPLVETRLLTEGTTEDDLSVELPIEAAHEGWSLGFSADLPDGQTSGPLNVAWFSHVLSVSDSDPDTQLLFFETIGDHYHQGGDINLNLVVDPAPADGDSIVWEWKWPGAEEWTVLPGASGLSHVIVAEQALHGVEVRAKMAFAGGDDELIADAVTIQVDDHGAAPRQQVSITGDKVVDGAATFANGEAGSFTANVSTATVLDTFQWFVKLPGASEAVPIHGATSATYDFTIAPMHDGTEVSVAVVKPGGALAYGPSAPVAVTVTGIDDEEPVSTTVTISGLADSYEVGDTMSLTASQDPETGEDHWHWFIKPAGSDAYSVISGELTSSLSRVVAAEDDGASIIARLYDHDHAVIAESAPVVVTVADAAEEPVPTTVTISGLEDSYDAGDSMSLTASQDPDTGEDHWHWFIKPAGSDAYSVISGELTSSLSRVVAVEDDGASIIARLYDHDHAVIAESAPVTVKVAAVDVPPVPGKPAQAPAARTAADLGDAPAGGINVGSSTVKPGDFLVIDLGASNANAWVAAWLFSTPTLLGGGWTQANGSGAITVQIPADAPLGAHRIAVFAADGSLIGWANLEVAQDAASMVGNPAGGELVVTGSELPVGAIAIALLLAFAGASLLVIRRRRHAGAE